MGITAKKNADTGRNPTAEQLALTRRVLELPGALRARHPTAIAADHGKLGHVNTYGPLPEYYLDLAFVCRRCGKTEIWKAADQKWFYEVAKGHIDARAVECHDCRLAKRRQ